ncbi:hypothetical protein QBA54_50785 [Streptomyces sp. B21-108]|uniref:hypothetical protein n=1 Tax=Streptomyces sp. B21-108 TaxID=3039419 RepID=UPI002FF14EB3
MPILDYEPGASPEAPGTLYFYEQGQDPSTGFQVSSKGVITGPNGSGTLFPTGDFQPSDHGLTAWAFDPSLVANSSTAVSGTLYLTKLPVRSAVTVSNLWWSILTVAVTPTAGQNWVGLYDTAGNRLVQAGVDAAVTSTGPKQTALTATALQPGYVWAAFLFNGATPPTVGAGSNFQTIPNINLAGATLRWAVNGTGRTTLPATITPGSNTTTGSLNYWAAMS